VGHQKEITMSRTLSPAAKQLVTGTVLALTTALAVGAWAAATRDPARTQSNRVAVVATTPAPAPSPAPVETDAKAQGSKAQGSKAQGSKAQGSKAQGSKAQGSTAGTATATRLKPKPRPLLADGRHAARITAVDTEGRTVTVDVIQFLTGKAAIKAASAAGEESPPPNDYFIVNDNPKLRTLPVRADFVTVNTLMAQETGSSTKSTVITFEDFAQLDTRYAVFWVTVRDGRVTNISEQFIP
jgi:hypothetical protein